MSEENKPKEDQLKENVKIETKENVKIETIESDIFVGDEDMFDVKVEYYKEDGKLYVKGIDDDFDLKKKFKEFKVYFKYPSFIDAVSIHQFAKIGNDEIEIMDMMKLEDARVRVLLRKWDLNKKISSLDSMHVKFIRAIKNGVRETIGMDGIL